MAKKPIIRAAIKSLEANGEAISKLENKDALSDRVKTINTVLLNLLKDDTV